MNSLPQDGRCQLHFARSVQEYVAVLYIASSTLYVYSGVSVYGYWVAFAHFGAPSVAKMWKTDWFRAAAYLTQCSLLSVQNCFSLLSPFRLWNLSHDIKRKKKRREKTGCNVSCDASGPAFDDVFLIGRVLTYLWFECNVLFKALLILFCSFLFLYMLFNCRLQYGFANHFFGMCFSPWKSVEQFLVPFDMRWSVYYSWCVFCYLFYTNIVLDVALQKARGWIDGALSIVVLWTFY